MNRKLKRNNMLSTIRKNLSISLIVCFCMLAVPSSAFAISLRDAKAQGLVGEQRNGYLGATNATPSSEVQALVNDINNKRRAEYQSIARRNGTPISAVEKVAAEKAIRLTPGGQFYQNAQGSWSRK